MFEHVWHEFQRLRFEKGVLLERADLYTAMDGVLKLAAERAIQTGEHETTYSPWVGTQDENE